MSTYYSCKPKDPSLTAPQLRPRLAHSTPVSFPPQPPGHLRKGLGAPKAWKKSVLLKFQVTEEAQPPKQSLKLKVSSNIVIVGSSVPGEIASRQWGTGRPGN